MESAVASLPTVSIAVIGAPGHGKSSFLNGLAQQRDKFKCGVGGQSCTQEVSSQQISLDNGLKISLTDTMGFPDPDSSKAAKYYDQVVAACNSPLNAIVWLMRVEREVPHMIENYSVLLREFANAKPPIIIVVNGCETYEDDAEREEKKLQHLEKSYAYGMSVANKIGISCAKVIAGAEKQDLKGRIRKELGATLAGTVPKTSNIKSFSALQRELSGCQSAEAQAQRAKQEEENTLSRIAEEKKQKEELIKDLDGKKDEKKSVYYRDWYKLWLGGHYEESWAHDREQMLKDIANAQVAEAELKGKLSEKQMSAAEKTRIFNERVRKTQEAQRSFQTLTNALHGAKEW